MSFLTPTGFPPLPMRYRTMDETMRILRIIHGAMLAAVPVAVAIAESVPHPSKPVPEFVLYLLGGLGLLELIAATAMRKVLVEPPETALQTDANDQRALFKWRNGQVVSFALCEAIVLYGFVLRLVGGPRPYAIAFYAVGTLFLLLYTPRRP